MLSTGLVRAPRTLVGLITAITVIPLLTLLWLGWRLLEQDRLLEHQQVQQRVERAADLIVSVLQRKIALSEQQLSSGGELLEQDVIAVTFRGDQIVAPQGRLAYLPVAPTLREAAAATFAESEGLEFRQRAPTAAIEALKLLSRSSDRAVLAGTLLRLGRNLQKTGRSEDALTSYARLAIIDDVSVGGVPAGLVGTYAFGTVLEQQRRVPELQAYGERFQRALSEGRWAVTSSVYSLYKKDADRWSGNASARSQQEIFAEAIGVLWHRWQSTPVGLRPSSGRETVKLEAETLTVTWQSGGGSFRALLARPTFVKAHWLRDIEPIAAAQQVVVEVGDLAPDDSSAGDRHPLDNYRAEHNTTESALPWAVAVSSVRPPPERSAFTLRRNLLIAGFLLLVAMAATAGYLVVRAVSRELAVARLQSDFVSTVSHEFRTPLTTLRQFTDMLREQPLLSAERPDIAYHAQSRATERLTKLVESILDFGRIQAGAHRYQFQSQDCAALVQRVVDDYSGEARARGYDVSFCAADPVTVLGDDETLSTAIRNLIDNAVKYSPRPHTVEVALRRRNGHALISVRDLGIGIPAHEQAAIFTKFHRGEQARIHGIKGTGIGLAMVQEIVHAHRGRIELQSAPGTGSIFTIVLPAKD